jgi:hypothetical protein
VEEAGANVLVPPGDGQEPGGRSEVGYEGGLGLGSRNLAQLPLLLPWVLGSLGPHVPAGWEETMQTLIGNYTAMPPL